jgi:hypothetical protein
MNIALLKAACASGLLLVALGALASPTAAIGPPQAYQPPHQAPRGDGRSPDGRHHQASLERSNGWANLGHEGSGLHRAESGTNALANLGHEGSGLMAAWQAAKLRPWAAQSSQRTRARNAAG